MATEDQQFQQSPYAVVYHTYSWLMKSQYGSEELTDRAVIGGGLPAVG